MGFASPSKVLISSGNSELTISMAQNISMFKCHNDNSLRILIFVKRLLTTFIVAACGEAYQQKCRQMDRADFVEMNLSTRPIKA
jgi:hypothetical protein